MQIILLPLVVIAAAASAVPIFICSWRPFTDSPELHNFEWYCNAQKRTVNSSHAVYNCDSARWHNVADFGYLLPFEDLLRFRAACPVGRADGWGLGGFSDCYSQTWAVCIGNNGPYDNPIQCYLVDRHDDCVWPKIFDNAEMAPVQVQVWKQKKS